MAYLERKVFTGGAVFQADLDLLKDQGEKVAHIIRLTLRTYANNIRAETGDPPLALGGRYRDDEKIPEEVKALVTHKTTVADVLRHSHMMPGEPVDKAHHKFSPSPEVVKRVEEDEAKDAVLPEDEEKVKRALDGWKE